ncbi:HS12A-like protein [Mya arenaria]|uniref:HS12A-like protein n=1 Tax=Mya arenaria TaxID=6604 RepID=A0ABY7EVR2_MYAAR|nr:HS12A-like protein [Mya arenaria]
MSTFLVVASIDFGTTYSGWAYSFRHEFEKDPTIVHAKTWHGGNFVSQKGPTCILIKPDGKTLEAFGYEAETKYADLAGENKHKKWYYFRRFKMKLFDKETLTMSLEIEDEDGKRLKASTVFSLSIRYLKEDLMKTSSDKLRDDITEKDIHWVITVPAIWSEPAKKFMRKAAREAASIYCRHLPLEKSSDTSVSSFKPGTTYLVLDAGGGTVDITVHEITQEGKLKELSQASGGPWGGTNVDDAFLALFHLITGVDIIERLKRENMEDYLELVRNFEVKKRDITDKAGTTLIRIPVSMMDLAEEMTGKTLKQILQDSPEKQLIRQDRDKLKLHTGVLLALFDITLIKKGDTVEAEKESEPKPFRPSGHGTGFAANLYCSSQTNPLFVDEDGCNFIGHFNVSCLDKIGNVGYADVSLLVGGTEIEARAVLQSTLEEVTATFDLPD